MDVPKPEFFVLLWIIRQPIKDNLLKYAINRWDIFVISEYYQFAQTMVFRKNCEWKFSQKEDDKDFNIFLKFKSGLIDIF